MKYLLFAVTLVVVSVVSYQAGQHPNTCPTGETPDSYALVEDWIRMYREQEKAVVTCSQDLSRAQNELGYDVVCGPNMCEIK